MANRTFNIAKGQERTLVNTVIGGSGTVRFLILRVAEADATLEDRATVAAILANNTELSDGWYARQTCAGLSVTENDSTETLSIDANDISLTTTNTGTVTAKGVFFYVPAGGNDANSIPLSMQDLVFTANGQVETIGVANFINITD